VTLSPDNVRRMGVFGLVHGGSHGAWCWRHLIEALAEQGHDAVAVDIPMDDLANGLDECARLAADQLAGRGVDVLVGHSIAGTFLPLAAAHVQPALMVFLCAMVPVEGQSLADQQAADPTMVSFPYDLIMDDQGRTLAPPDVARALYYSDCSDDVVAAAVAQLRPQAGAVRAGVFPDGGWPQIPSAYILCTEDPVVSPDWSRRVARERLGVEPLELPGGHSPMLSRPQDLARLLASLTPR
jgi:pimeloyl-ACP methyl ester carboxylesterase